MQNNALFMRLDSFLERCHDILDLTQTIVQFSKLSKIEVGGTKGNTLTASVKQVYRHLQEPEIRLPPSYLPSIVFYKMKTSIFLIF